jgi:hypothetical protein
MSTIPASEIVNVTPGVLSAGGSSLNVIALMLSNSNRVPVGTVKPFATKNDVADFFGSDSVEAKLASIYFKGYNNATAIPGSLLFAQYNQSAVSAYERGGPIGASATVAQIAAMSGDISINVDGAVRSASALSLGAATSYSNAASIIETALNDSPPTNATFTGSISGSELTVTAMASGVIAVGQQVVGTDVTAGTVIVALGTGTGSTGTYTVNNSQSVSSEDMTTQPAPVVVSYDSLSQAFTIASSSTGAVSTIQSATGSLATSLLLTSATGAVLSQGAAPASPTPFMNEIIDQTQNWVTFMTTFDPDNGSGNAVRLAFAQWVNQQDDQYCYVVEDDDEAPTVTVPATSSLGVLIQTQELEGTNVNFNNQDFGTIAAFVCGSAASIDFARTNGRTTFADLQQDGLVASVTNASVARNLADNGYNFYGAYATRNSDFVIYRNGVVSGDFQWMDSYIDQIWLNSMFQLALMQLLTSIGSIPYNPAGYALIEAALSDSINAGLNFGAYRPNVTLSSTQIAEVNQAAGAEVASTLQARGWYLQILDASPAVRAKRGSPPMTFWYVDGQSVQSISLNSVAVQ